MTPMRWRHLNQHCLPKSLIQFLTLARVRTKKNCCYNAHPCILQVYMTLFYSSSAPFILHGLHVLFNNNRNKIFDGSKKIKLM